MTNFIIFLTLIIITFISRIGELSFPFNLLEHSRHYFTVFLIICALFSYKNIKRLLVIFLVVIINIFLLLPSIKEIKQSGIIANRPTIFYQNILNGNFNYINKLKLQFSKNIPDIIILSEAFKDDQTSLTEHKYKYLSLRTDNYGFAIYSKYSLKIIETIAFDGINVGIYFEIPDSNFKILAVHLPPPIMPDLFTIQQIALKRIKEIVLLNKDHHFILLGDFNITPWSREFLSFTNDLSHLGIAHATIGKWPFDYFFGLPIDHVFCSVACSLKKYELIGSDHIGYTVQL